MMYGTMSRAHEIREQAAEEITNRPDDFKTTVVFLIRSLLLTAIANLSSS